MFVALVVLVIGVAWVLLTRDDRGQAQKALDAVDMRLEPVMQLTYPTSVVQRPATTDLYATSLQGDVVRAPRTGGPATVVASVAELILLEGESGLLDLAFDAGGRHLFLSVVERNGDLVVWEVPMAGERPDVAQRRDVIRVASPTDVHHAGDIYIDPEGMLWWAVGEGGPKDSFSPRAQDLTDLHGKLLRLDPRPQPDGRPYGIPAANPFSDRTDARAEIWALGLRNPWRFSIDEPTGDLWIGDVGRTDVEEIDFAAGPAGGRGFNFGWPFFEGDLRQVEFGAPADLATPLLTWRHDERCGVTGGFVYRGELIPGLVGAYVYSDLCDGVVRAVLEANGAVVAERAFETARTGYPVSFGLDADGELYVCSFDDGTIFKLVPT